MEDFSLVLVLCCLLWLLSWNCYRKTQPPVRKDFDFSSLDIPHYGDPYVAKTMKRLSSGNHHSVNTGTNRIGDVHKQTEQEEDRKSSDSTSFATDALVTYIVADYIMSEPSSSSSITSMD